MISISLQLAHDSGLDSKGTENGVSTYWKVQKRRRHLGEVILAWGTVPFQDTGSPSPPVNSVSAQRGPVCLLIGGYVSLTDVSAGDESWPGLWMLVPGRRYPIAHNDGGCEQAE